MQPARAQAVLVGPGFQGLTSASNNYPFPPPDPILAVGPAHVVEVVNSAIAYYNKPSGTLAYSTWFQGGPAPFFTAATMPVLDPKCAYDAQSSRFFIVGLERGLSPQQSFIDLAVSDDSNPSGFTPRGVWNAFRHPSLIVVGGTPCYADYPGLGTDASAVYVTALLRPFTFGGCSFGACGLLFRIYDKALLLANTPQTPVDIVVSGPMPLSSAVQVAHVIGAPPAPYFVSVASPSALRLHTITNPLSGPALSAVDVPVPAMILPPTGTGAPQAGSSSVLDVLDGRITSVLWRDETLYAAHAIQLTTGGKTIVRWYEIATKGWPQPRFPCPQLLRSGDIAPPDSGTNPVHTFFPAIAANGRGGMAVAHAQSSAAQFASVQFAGRDPCAASVPVPTTLAQGGTAAYSPTAPGSWERWGDYFGAAVDPADDSTFWGIGEYATGISSWSTWIRPFTVGTGTQRRLRVISTGIGGVPITMSPAPCTGGATGATNFTAEFPASTAVTLTAPPTVPRGGAFVSWQINDGAPITSNVVAVTMTGNISAVANYTPSLASWSTYGSGWPGTGGVVPSLALSAHPVAGTTVNALIGNSSGVAQAGAVLLIDVFRPSPPYYPNYLGLGGTLLLGPPFPALPAIQVQLALAAGTTTVPLPVPVCVAPPATVYLQCLQIDAGASAGYSFTAGIEAIIGS